MTLNRESLTSQTVLDRFPGSRTWGRVLITRVSISRGLERLAHSRFTRSPLLSGIILKLRAIYPSVINPTAPLRRPTSRSTRYHSIIEKAAGSTLILTSCGRAHRVAHGPAPSFKLTAAGESTRAQISDALLSDSLSSFFARWKARDESGTDTKTPSDFLSSTSSFGFVIIDGHEIALQYVNKSIEVEKGANVSSTFTCNRTCWTFAL
ncbi:hypothetical protein PUN28_019358 [Cardiocondyla obscurior]|uniref:Uncharacterized protein n=1 Tax=Cardiocondyla obscurior TaxID=286306 RepID=A0AAW2EF40_9HYME